MKRMDYDDQISDIQIIDQNHEQAENVKRMR